VTRQKLLAAERSGDGAWHAQTEVGTLKLVPFTALEDARYTTYLNVV
jgi:hypothetical protein